MNATKIHPYVSRKEQVLLQQKLSVQRISDILQHCHPTNRKRNSARQQALKRDIHEGNYRNDVGHFIKFDRQGHLIDGQKRMYAHLEMNKPLTINVHFGLPTDAMLYIDRNQPRTIACNVTLAKTLPASRQPTTKEFSYDRLIYAIATWCKHGLRWEQPGSPYDKFIWSETELSKFIRKHQNAMEFVLVEERITNRPSILAAMVIYYLKTKKYANEFRALFYGLKSTPLNVGHPISTLQTYARTKSSGGSRPLWDYFNSLRCINAFHLGHSIVGSQLNGQREQFAF